MLKLAKPAFIKVFLAYNFSNYTLYYSFKGLDSNRFKGLYLIERVAEELWKEAHESLQEAVIKTISKKKKCKKG